MGREVLKSFRDLRVWRAAKDLVVKVYRATEGLPRDERFGLTSQIRRSAVSVPANIAEGYGRQNRGEYVQFLGIANGSLRELETLLILAAELGYLGVGEELLVACDSVGKQLSALRLSLKRAAPATESVGVFDPTSEP